MWVGERVGGIGLQMVRELLSRGGDVVATSRHPQQSIELVETERASGGRLMLIQMDTTSEASIERAALEVRQRHERVDLLVNVSGLLHGPDGFMPETSLDKGKGEEEEEWGDTSFKEKETHLSSYFLFFPKASRSR